MRRLLSLVKGLPQEGTALERLLVPDPIERAYTPTVNLLDAVVTLLDEANHLFYYANRAEDAGPFREPIELRRPSSGVDELADAKPRQATPEEMRRFFGGAIRYTGPPAEQSPATMVDHLA